MSKVIIKGAILSYPRFDEPEAIDGGEPKYGCTLVITNDDDLKRLKSAVAEVGKEAFGDKFAKGLRSGGIKSPFHQTDPEKDFGYPEGSSYIRVRTKDQPGMVAVWRGADGKPARVDADQFYAGCIVNASVAAFAYNKGINKGVSFALNNVQFVTDGPRLDNRIAAEDEFEVDEDAEAPLEDLDGDEDIDPNEDLDEDDEPSPYEGQAKKAARKAKKSASKSVKVETEEDDLSDLM